MVVRLFHETGVGQAASIIATRTMGSITYPYPAEFLLHESSPGFVNIGAFKGRGVMLVFDWCGEQADHFYANLDACGPDVLCNIFTAVDFGDGACVGQTDAYWHSRIISHNGSNLKLIGARFRPISDVSDNTYVIDTSKVGSHEIQALNETIGAGIHIAVPGIAAPNLNRGYLEEKRASLGGSNKPSRWQGLLARLAARRF